MLPPMRMASASEPPPGGTGRAAVSPALHTELAAGRWFTLSLAAQMANIGSELSRALKWRGRNDRLSAGALERALELFGLTLADPRHRRSRARLREIARAREVVLDSVVGENDYATDPAALQRYFDAFALAAINERRRLPQGSALATDRGREG